MSSDGEINKNQESEGDTKPNLDTTDSSQDSVAAKSEVEDKEEKMKNNDAEVKEEKDKPTEETKKSDDKKEEDKDKKPEKVEEKQNNEVHENDTDKKDDKKKEKDDKEKNEKNDTSKEDSKEEIKNGKEKKKDVKSEEDTEEGDHSGEEEEDEEDDKEKEVPLLDQPLEKSGKRDRKTVQRFNEEFPTEVKESPKVDIIKGAGAQLGDIPRIDSSISRFKIDDLKLLHKVLFQTPGKAALIRKNIKKFSGFEFTKDDEGYTKKIQQLNKMEVKHLKSICEMLELDKNGKKEEISERICEFLIEPKDSGKPATGGRPKRTAAVRANNRGYSSHDDGDDSDEGSRRASRSTRGKGVRPSLKDDTTSESEAEFRPSEEESADEDKPPRVTGKRKVVKAKKQESEDEVSDVEETPSDDEESDDEPKSKRKKTPVKVQNNRSKRKGGKKTPAKKTPGRKKGSTRAAKKRKHESDSEEEDEKDNSEHDESSSGDDEPLVKKSKTPQPPTDDEIKSYVKEILEGANLEEITMKTVCKQVYAHYPDFDLAHKKDFIKTTVKSLIST